MGRFQDAGAAGRLGLAAMAASIATTNAASCVDSIVVGMCIRYAMARIAFRDGCRIKDADTAMQDPPSARLHVSRLTVHMDMRAGTKTRQL